MEKRNACRTLVGKPERYKLLGRPRHRWKYTIKMNLSDIRCSGVDIDDLVHDKDQWQVLLNMARNFQVP
jgi:hypothetical protein